MSNHTNGDAKGTPNLIELAKSILEQTTSISQYLEKTNHAPPSFAPNSSEPPQTPEYLALHSTLKSTLEDLQDLIDGPRRSLRSFVCQGNDLAAFQVACDFELFTHVPLEGEISISDLAKKAGLDADRTTRCLRMLATHRMFEEPRPGFFSHTGASYIISSDEELRCSTHFMQVSLIDEMFKAATATSDCLKAFPHESTSTDTPFRTRHGVPVFTYYAQNPGPAARFAKAMSGMTRTDRQFSELKNKFRWEKLQGTVVDVGGGSGHVSIELAKTFPNLNFVVQDQSADMLAQGKTLAESVEGRIKWMQHNFFEPQPLRDVAAFFIRQCTHNWCDKDVVRIFKGFVPGLEGSAKGTPLLVNDTVMAEPGTRPAHEERALRQVDMLMMIGYGAKQRTKAEFEELLKEADSRYEIVDLHAGGSMGLLEVRLNV